jgi:L-fuconate dehydratase
MIQHYALWDQIAVSARSDIQFVEYLNFLQEDAFLNPVRVKNGSYVAPTSPGWGLEMHAEFIDAHTYPTGSVWVGREASGGVTFIA